ncbi:MAG: DHH family phosphoesterase [Erysipelotrichaceae bacterium]
MDQLEKIEVQLGIVVFLEMIAVALLVLLEFTTFAFAVGVMVVINTLICAWIINQSKKNKSSSEMNISRALGSDVKDALLVGKIGIITYDETMNITWISEFLSNRNLNLIGKKITSWIPELNRLFQDDIDSMTASDGAHLYEITRKDDAQVLFVRDVETFVNVKNRLENEQLVLGLLHLDNYNEYSQHSDEHKITMISNNLRPMINQWAKANNIILRRLKSDRYFMVLNEESYQNLVAEGFGILNQVRLESQRIDVSITVSMAFARGNTNLTEQDGVINDLIELAQVRGGDQVVSKHHGEDTEFFGGGSQAQEKRSRVRVRVMAQAIKEAIDDVQRVFIVGHKNMDFDCMGSAIAMSRIAASYNKEVYIVSQSGGIETQLSEVLTKMEKELQGRHRFISDAEALKLANAQDLIIAVDHHNPSHSNAPLVMEKVERKVVIDHHRRSEQFIENPLIVYVETSASSVSELVVEMMEYQSNKVDISEEEAMIMYLGLLIDTNHFKNRTGVRTFEAAAKLKGYGVEPQEAENLLQEGFADFEAKATIMKNMKRYNEEIIVAAVTDLTHLNRTIMSQVADQLLSIKNIEATFVIAYIDENLVAVSSRSREKINVQFIMEKMHGGGHFNAAALQRKDTSVEAVEAELYQILDGMIVKEEKK